MITQQVASYLIKKMDATVKNSNNHSTDQTDKLFKRYLISKNKKSPADVVIGGQIDNNAIAEAFRWRAADLV